MTKHCHNCGNSIEYGLRDFLFKTPEGEALGKLRGYHCYNCDNGGVVLFHEYEEDEKKAFASKNMTQWRKEDALVERRKSK